MWSRPLAFFGFPDSFCAAPLLTRTPKTVKHPPGNGKVVVLPNKSKEGDVAVYEQDVIPAKTGRLGYAVRVSPNHYDDPLTRPVTSLLKWGGR